MSNCIFCGIAEKRLSAKILYEDTLCLAFEDISPKAPSHVLIIPRKHIESLDAMEETDEGMMGHLFLVAKNLARERRIAVSGYRVVLNTGLEAGQSVFHLHLHLLGGRRMAWPPG
jgi:histidine triad (HIT) family protein